VRTISLTGDTLYKKDLENAKKHFSTQCVFEHRYASSEIIVGASMIISPGQIIDTDIIPLVFHLVTRNFGLWMKRKTGWKRVR